MRFATRFHSRRSDTQNDVVEDDAQTVNSEQRESRNTMMFANEPLIPKHKTPDMPVFATITDDDDISSQDIHSESLSSTPSFAKGVTQTEDVNEKASEHHGRKLRRRTNRVAQVVSWFVAIAFPIFFLVLGILNAVQHHQPLTGSGLGHAVVEIDKIAVSLWPILFAAVVAQSLRMYAAWQVERGILLIDLEQLIGCNSLAAAMKQPFVLFTLNWTTVALLLIWSLSPIAGQSFVRMLGPSVNPFSNVTAVHYLATAARPSDLTDFHPVAASFDIIAPEIAAYFASALVSTPESAMNNTQDVSLRPRVPSVVSEGGYSYPSLLGLPLSGVPSNASSSFTVPYTYFSLQCAPFVNTTLDVLTKNLKDWPPEYSYGEPWSYGVNLHPDQSSSTWMAVPPNRNAADPYAGHIYFALNNSFPINDPTASVPNQPFNNSSKPPPEPKLLNHSTTRNASNYGMSFLNCTYMAEHLKANMRCATGPSDCHVSDVVDDPTIPSNSVNLTDSFAYDFINAMGDLQGDLIQGTQQGSVISSFVLFPNNIWAGAENMEPSTFTTPTIDFGKRLEMLVNTYWQTVLYREVLNVSVTADWSPTQLRALANLNASVVNASTTYDFPAYKVSWGWVILLLLSSILLLFFGIIGIILDMRTIGPDILGFASSLTRDNQYIEVEHDVGTGGIQRQGSSLSAIETAKELRDHKVMLQDVRSHRAVGKVALASVGVANGAPLSKERLYA